ncbi:hypothetical protein scyTo_0003052 [Scyliorhinus torazame]|uniref:Uncharacterized protein n=1 Tax=Scyliorhinus torazame TaxID=75743 RepID=A0A401PLH3_SCYTO|nr:hypothetical protein [Scyliorhinus torazame]
MQYYLLLEIGGESLVLAVNGEILILQVEAEILEEHDVKGGDSKIDGPLKEDGVVLEELGDEILVLEQHDVLTQALELVVEGVEVKLKEIDVLLQKVEEDEQVLAQVVVVVVDDVLKIEHVAVAPGLVVWDELDLLHVAMVVSVGPVLEVEGDVGLGEAQDVVLIQVTEILEVVEGVVLQLQRKSDADQNSKVSDTAP